MFKRVDNQDIIQQKLSDGSMKRYVKGRLLGKGGFAKCYEVISLQTQKKYAAKIIEKAGLQKSKAKQKLTSQIKIHKSLTHQYVVHFQHYFEDSEFVYILLQKCSNQTLNELLKRRKRLTDIQTKYYIRQLALAIKYIHEQQIIHRDLKLGNLFLSEKLQIKIGDFGLATKLSHAGERKKTKCGTPNYIAPEILDDKKTHSYEVDVWSMGAITYALLVGKPPFQTNDVKDTYNKIKACDYMFPDSAGVTEVAKKFISTMLQLDPSKRATIDQILADPFLSQMSIPASLPISSLACPPSFDFLKKYRDAEAQQSRSLAKSTVQHLQKSSLRQQQKYLKNSANPFSHEKPLTRNDINSTHKLVKSNQRVLSAANLLSNGVGKSKQHKKQNKTKGKKIRQLNQNERMLAGKSLKNWVTYFQENPKFGLGYLLNSGAAGFKFNDCTAMVANSAMSKLKYIQYDAALKKMKQQQGIIFKPEQAQQKQHKKYKILCHFQRQLLKIKMQSQNEPQNQGKKKGEEIKCKQSTENALKCFVTRYHRTNKSTIFWLSINAVQVIFEDNSEILVNNNGVITYVNKYREKFYFQQKNKQNQSEQIKKRLLHFYSVAKNILMKKPSNTENENIQKNKCDEGKGEKQQMMTRCNSSKLGATLNANSTRHLKTSSSSTNIIQKSSKVARK